MDDNNPLPPWTNPRGEMPVSPGVKLRLFEPDKDYDLVKAWWTAHGWDAVPAGKLPMGLVATMDGADIAAGWIYCDLFTGLGMLEWLVTNPDAKPRQSYRCIQAVANWLVWRVGEDDLRVNFVVTTCRQGSLARLLENCGFNPSVSEVFQLSI